MAYTHPLMGQTAITEYIELPRRMLNILLLGIDFGPRGYRGSAWKNEWEECHTDAIMLLAVNLDEQKIDIVSLPRDTVTYVPGVKGIYKLNAAFNCGVTIGGTVEAGLEKTCEAASWLLGGVKVDAYCAVDMVTMIERGDAMGGVDFETELAYKGTERR
jgi:anionic cell wall polymer biosynthesis LytR-Cps2A-Psr (LCP) family protein